MAERRTIEHPERKRRSMVSFDIDIGGHPVLAIALASLQRASEREAATPEARGESRER